MLVLLHLLLLLVQSTFGTNLVNICPSSTKPAQSQGLIYSPFLVIKGGLSCTLTLSDIPAGTWFGVINLIFHLEQQAEQCKDQKLYLSVSHPAKPTDYFCGDNLPKILYTAYSSESVSVNFTLSTPQYYDRITNIFQLEYRVAKVIYKGYNAAESALIQTEDSIISHSSYPQLKYESNINSSLTLTGARLASTLQLKFYKLSFAPGCLDYLQLTGAKGLGGDKPKFCMKDSSLLNQWIEYIVTSTRIQFHFVASSDVGGLGFRFDYRVVSDTGCESLEIPNSRVNVDTVDSRLHTYTVSCEDGHFLEGSNITAARVLCTGGKWWLLSSCTDECRSMDVECFKRCNVSSSDAFTLKCTRTPADMYGEEISMKAYIGILVGIIGSLLLLVVVGTVIACHRKKKKEQKKIGATTTTPLDTSPCESQPHIDETADSYGRHTLSNESSVPLQQPCRGSVTDEDGYHVPMLQRANPAVQHKAVPLPTKPFKPASDSLVAPYSSVDFPGKHNLMDQSGVHLLADPSGGNSATASGSEDVYYLAADAYAKVQMKDQNPYHIPVPVTANESSAKVESPLQRQPGDGASVEADKNEVKAEISPHSNYKGSSSR